mmetsp:Transcript_29198/g.57261  ORF Transcript_29198/g.57261 Transcript_29198/m.57261 type:complete len:214 (-) Transcript_29198:1538-2179(-)
MYVLVPPCLPYGTCRVNAGEWRTAQKLTLILLVDGCRWLGSCRCMIMDGCVGAWTGTEACGTTEKQGRKENISCLPSLVWLGDPFSIPFDCFSSSSGFFIHSRFVPKAKRRKGPDDVEKQEKKKQTERTLRQKANAVGLLLYGIPILCSSLSSVPSEASTELGGAPPGPIKQHNHSTGRCMCMGRTGPRIQQSFHPSIHMYEKREVDEEVCRD